MKTRNRLYLIVVAFFLLPFICLTASADVAEGTETRITSSDAEQTLPAIYGDRIVWMDDRNGNLDIYMYDLSTSNETRITTDESNQVAPSIYGDRIVWTDYRNGTSDIYMYDLSTSNEIRITSDESNQDEPAIYGDKIVWRDSRNGNTDIYMYDLSTSNETRISTDDSNQVNPAIYGDRILWEDNRNVGTDLYMYDLSTSNESWLFSTFLMEPTVPYAIFGDWIVWVDGRDYANTGTDIYMYDLANEEETRITYNVSDQHYPAIYNDRIVWVDVYYDMDIYMYNLTTATETKICTSGLANYPEIYGDRIVWQDTRNGNSDIYMFTLAPAVELTPLDRINALKDYVENTLSSSKGVNKALLRPLYASIYYLESGNEEKSVFKLKLFIKLVEKFNERDRVSDAEADYMIAEAREIIDQIEAQ